MLRFAGFLAAGLPAFLIALGLNYLLVQGLGVPKIAAYGPVLVLQALVNYISCRLFVFPASARQHPFWRHFGRFLGGSGVFRLLDWVLYGILTWAGVHYIVAQALNVVVFALLRFRFVEWLFLGRGGQ